MDLAKLQEEVNKRWGSQDTNICHRSDTNHALVHLMKALGKIASAVNDAEHEQRAPRADEVEKPLADLVICAARFAHGIVDLDVACAARLAAKFPRGAHVQLQHDTGPQGNQPCRRCGVRCSPATVYVPCFEEGDTLATWKARNQQVLDACVAGSINDSLRTR